MRRIIPYATFVIGLLLIVAAWMIVSARGVPPPGDTYQPLIDFDPPPPSPPEEVLGEFDTFLQRLRLRGASFRLQGEALAQAEEAFRNMPGVPPDSVELGRLYFSVDAQKVFGLYRGLPTLEHGLELYNKHCAVCHGPEGRGNGPATRRWQYGSYPRNFWRGKYKNRTTEYGEMPTDSDLFRTLTRGLYGTVMPSYRHLSTRDRWSLVQFLKTLSNFYDLGRVYNTFDPEYSEGPPKAFAIGPAPAATPESVARGRTLFAENCIKCHQREEDPLPTGVGRGQGNQNWQDEMFRPVPHSRDLTAGLFHVGTAPSDLFRFISAGSDIGPMPTYLDLPPEDRWALVHYIQSLFTPADG